MIRSPQLLTKEQEMNLYLITTKDMHLTYKAEQQIYVVANSFDSASDLLKSKRMPVAHKVDSIRLIQENILIQEMK